MGTILCASRWNKKQRLGLCFLHFIYSNGSLQRHQGQSFKEKIVCHWTTSNMNHMNHMYMNHIKYVVSKFLDIIYLEFSKSQPDLIINERFLHSEVIGQPNNLNRNIFLCAMMLMMGFLCNFPGQRRYSWLRQNLQAKSTWKNPCPHHWSTKLLSLPNVLLVCVLESSFFIALKQMLKKLKQHLTMPDTLTVGQYIPFQGHERLTIPGKSIPIQLDSKP